MKKTNSEPTTHFYFFSGKGGVGKTTMSAASAVHYASQGKKTLIVTTDPASNLADVFEQKIGHAVTPIKSQHNLFAMELDPDKATTEYKEKTLAPLKGLLPDASMQVLEEQLNSPCTAEMASFDRFTDFLQESDFDIIIFDTAPTGHTLRLLELPVEWSGVIEQASKDGSSGQTCIGPAQALADSKKKFDTAIAAMRDPQQTTFIFVLRPEATPLYEAKRSIAELAQLKIHQAQLIVNGLYPKPECTTAFMLGRYAKQQQLLQQIKQQFKNTVNLMYLESHEIMGLKSLQQIGDKLLIRPLLLSDYEPDVLNAHNQEIAYEFAEMNPEIKKLITPHKKQTRLVFFAGKGGVGKTSIAAATALWTSGQLYKTLLLTTDPASHLKQLFGQEVSDKPTKLEHTTKLWVAKIDATQAVKAYKQRILAEARKKYDEQRLIAIEEELNSPCTEEMATFEKFIEFVSSEDYEVIVFDTAPTGHTLRLLQLPVDWSKQLAIKTFSSTGETELDKQTKARFVKVIARMQDPNQTTFSFVMYPEATPIAEAARAMADLKGIGIGTNLIVANLVLDGQGDQNLFWKTRSGMQQKYLKQMSQQFKAPIVQLPMLADDLIGIPTLSTAGQLLYGYCCMNG